MIDDERRWMEECDRRREERDRRLDDLYEYRDTEPFKKSDDEGEKDDE
jgi:hypothetical protein